MYEVEIKSTLPPSRVIIFGSGNPKKDLEITPDKRITDALAKVHADFSQYTHDFTSLCSDICSNVIIWHSDLKLQMVGGTFTLDKRGWNLRRIQEPHAWLTDSNGVIFDLTLSQFNSGLQKQNEFPVGVCVILPGSPLAKRYTRNGIVGVVK